ncbi:hypothetical protein [Streptomyces sp. NPDC050564]|uniref:hypothetical protein n=1 Tax=Streptomyces sp. NPDC050564 TaxID=3365631 RepID=UPI0037BCD2ED
MWKPYTVVDRNLFTGQNPASAGVLAERLLEVLYGISLGEYHPYGKGQFLGMTASCVAAPKAHPCDKVRADH